MQPQRKSSPGARLFAFNWIIYFIIMVITTLYVYIRLDYVRSGPPPQTTTKQP